MKVTSREKPVNTLPEGTSPAGGAGGEPALPPGRPTSMKGTRLVAALAAGAAVLAGCGQQHTPRSGAVAPVHRSSADVARCHLPKLPPGRVLDITEKDNGKAFCVVRGVHILVFLHGTLAHSWTRPRATSPVLQAEASGIFTLMRGVTGGSFVAARPGSATISSARCASNLRMAEPNGSVCSPDLRFRVTVVVLGQP